MPILILQFSAIMTEILIVLKIYERIVKYTFARVSIYTNLLTYANRCLCTRL